jgi:hypothetical protein
MLISIKGARHARGLAKYFTRGEYNHAIWIWKDLPSGVFCEMTPK